MRQVLNVTQKIYKPGDLVKLRQYVGSIAAVYNDVASYDRTAEARGAVEAVGTINEKSISIVVWSDHTDSWLYIVSGHIMGYIHASWIMKA